MVATPRLLITWICSLHLTLQSDLARIKREHRPDPEPQSLPADGVPAETVICIGRLHSGICKCSWSSGSGDLHGNIDQCLELWGLLEERLGPEKLDEATVVSR